MADLEWELSKRKNNKNPRLTFTNLKGFQYRHRGKNNGNADITPTYKGGNSSNHRKTIAIERTYNKTYLRDVENYDAVDQTVISGVKNHCKTHAPFLVSETRERMNTQNHRISFSKKNPWKSNNRIPRHITLPEINSNITLSNVHYAWENWENYHTVIYVGTEKLFSKKIHHIPLMDSGAISYNYFVKCVDTFLELADTGKSVLLYCDGGVNRSPAILCAYAISRGFSMSDVISLIENAKKSVNLPWDTLTNSAFVRILKRYEKELK